MRSLRHWPFQAGRWRWLRGEYETWEEARAASVGYADDAILAKVVRAARDVRAGRALWDRDGVTFSEPYLNEPLLTALQDVAREQGGRLDVVDFGGGLGSTWWQHRLELGEVSRWRVVEQPAYVAAGQEFANGVLSFHSSLGEVQSASPSSAILLSGVLSYLEKPLELLVELSDSGFSHVIVDRTPFVLAGADRLVVQHSPPDLGGDSYPCWLFERASVITALGADYVLEREWPGTDVIDRRVEFRGLYLRRRSTQ